MLVGAQAIYLQVGGADLAVAPYTTDGDLVVNPSILGKVPPLEQALGFADFQPKPGAVGIWVTHRPTSFKEKTEIAIDLLVPSSVSPGKGRRAARLEGHDSRAARIVKGLEGALVDTDVLTVGSLETADARRFEIRVAGPAALLIAKLHKVNDRHESSRQSDKDALDVLRLLRGVATEELARRMRLVVADKACATIAEEALRLLRELFASRRAPGSQMAARATGGLVDADEVATSCELLSVDLLDLLEGR